MKLNKFISHPFWLVLIFFIIVANEKCYYIFKAGGFAGFVVDFSIFPLDTLKTRLQSPQGFVKAGGFHNVYKGIGPQMIGSVPQG